LYFSLPEIYTYLSHRIRSSSRVLVLGTILPQSLFAALEYRIMEEEPFVNLIIKLIEIAE